MLIFFNNQQGTCFKELTAQEKKDWQTGHSSARYTVLGKYKRICNSITEANIVTPWKTQETVRFLINIKETSKGN